MVALRVAASQQVQGEDVAVGWEEEARVAWAARVQARR